MFHFLTIHGVKEKEREEEERRERERECINKDYYTIYSNISPPNLTIYRPGVCKSRQQLLVYIVDTLLSNANYNKIILF